MGQNDALLFSSEIIKGLTNGYVQGMEIRREKEKNAADAKYKQDSLALQKQEMSFKGMDFPTFSAEYSKTNPAATPVEKQEAYLQSQKPKGDDFIETMILAGMKDGPEKEALKEAILQKRGLKPSAAKTAPPMDFESFAKLPENSGKAVSDVLELYNQKALGKVTAGAQKEIKASVPGAAAPQMPADMKIYVDEQVKKGISVDKAIEKYKRLGVKPDKPGSDMTIGEETADKEFSKRMVAYEATGRAEMNKYLTNLDQAKKDLISGKASPGMMFKGLNTIGLGGVMPNTKKNMQSVHESALNALQALKGSLSDADRTFITGLSFDESLPVEQNVEKINTAIKYINAQRDAIEGMIKTYRKDKSIRNYVAPSVNRPSADSLYSEKIERGIQAVMKAKGWSREKTESALKKAGKI